MPGKRTRRVYIPSGEHFDVYVGRGEYPGKPGGFGNPYTHLRGKTTAEHVVSSRAEAVAMYKAMALGDKELRGRILSLKGKTLGCWCKPGEDCHGDVIADIADGRLPFLDI